MGDTVHKSDEEWRRLLTPEQYRITRQKGTERAFSGQYHNFKGEGIYRCVCCGRALFCSSAQYDSGSGWPSFWEPISAHCVREERDTRCGMVRTEILCEGCNAHLGHVFADGPPPTGRRYCANSAALEFVEKKKE